MRNSFHFDSEFAKFGKGGICFDGLRTGQDRDAFRSHRRKPILIFSGGRGRGTVPSPDAVFLSASLMLIGSFS
jgi:hypothetical protein